MWFLQPGITISDVLMRIFASLVIIFLVMPFNQFVHGWVAYKLGDDTAKNSGRLTLDPMSHFDPLGAFSILVFDIGWSKPVPINASNFNSPRLGLALTALSGPASHIIAAIFGVFLLNLTSIFPSLILSELVQKFFLYYILINVSIAAFNFLPVPPLDGYRILESLIPNKYLTKYYSYYPLILVILLGLMLFGFFEIPLMFIRKVVYSLVMSVGGLPFSNFVV